MSITAVPISMRLVFAPTAASRGKGRGELSGEVMHTKIGAVGAQFFSRNGEIDGLQQGVFRRARLRLRRGGPVTEGEEADLLHDEAGWGTWIRTKTNRVRVCCATVTPFPNGLSSLINGLCGYLDKSPAPGSGQITARWLRRSTRSILPLASAEEGPFLDPSRPANARRCDGPVAGYNRDCETRMRGPDRARSNGIIDYRNGDGAALLTRTADTCDQKPMPPCSMARRRNLPASGRHAMLARPSKKRDGRRCRKNAQAFNSPATSWYLWETFT